MNSKNLITSKEHNISIFDIMNFNLTENEVNELIDRDYYLQRLYSSYPDYIKQDILDFLIGKASLNITYNNFFLKIMFPDNNTERLQEFISAVIGKQIKIEKIYPREGNVLVDKGSFVIMDIIAKGEDGSFINVEMQKIGYDFPGERSECYIADTIIRQYNYQKAKWGDKFNYTKMQPCYLIILMERSAAAFKKVSPLYLHTRQISYDSKAEVPSIENVKYISLDTFNEIMQDKDISSELEAWLTFLSCKDLNKIDQLINKYPRFINLYKDISMFKKDPKELIRMYSETLTMMDRNLEFEMLKNWMDQSEAAVRETEAAKRETEAAKKEFEVAKKETEVAKKETEVAKKETEAAKKESEEYKKQLAEKDKLIAELQAKLNNH